MQNLDIGQNTSKKCQNEVFFAPTVGSKWHKWGALDQAKKVVLDPQIVNFGVQNRHFPGGTPRKMQKQRFF